jgi:hypothetical protein
MMTLFGALVILMWLAIALYVFTRYMEEIDAWMAKHLPDPQKFIAWCQRGKRVRNGN